MRQQLLRSFIAVSVASLALTAALSAGPLDPPAGMIVSTPGPEPRIAINATNTPGDANSLFRIDSPGSYYLASNITGVSARHGIEIAASGVTIDLNGFDLIGVPGALDGISTSALSLNNITITNGSLHSWPGDGIDLLNLAAFNCRIEGVSSSDNLGSGIIAGGASAVIHCAARNNGVVGIATGSGCTLTSCVASTNGTHGFSIGLDATALNCTAHNNLSSGIITGAGASLTNCSTSGNGATGITASSGSTLNACVALTNTGTGISMSSGCTATACSANSNFGIGISANNGCAILDSAARSNTLHGIVANADSLIRGNISSSNGTSSVGAGIQINGLGNRVESNSCTGSDIGIEVTAAGNLIIQNSCAHNTVNNWSIVANNKCLVILGVNAGIITGDSGGSSPGSTNPNANYTY